jgi:hypothetical protein
VPLAGRAEAHGKAGASFRKAFLISRRHHGGIEERCCLHGVLHGEERSDEQLARLTHGVRLRQEAADRLVVFLKDCPNVRMLLPEIGFGSVQELESFRFGHAHHTFDDALCPWITAWAKETRNGAAWIGFDPVRQPFDIDAHGSLRGTFSIGNLVSILAGTAAVRFGEGGKSILRDSQVHAPGPFKVHVAYNRISSSIMQSVA